MSPTLADGQKVFFSTFEERSPLPHDIVLFSHPYKRMKLVKRISHITDEGKFFMVGDNPDILSSEDSHNFGPIAKEKIIGILIKHK
tara:strand:- start:1152 stop:1409 length:258 start_codon:yes stop_codon:yes gene_type:complete